MSLMPLFIASILILVCAGLLAYLQFLTSPKLICRHKWRILENHHRMDNDGELTGWSTFYECTKCKSLKVKDS